MRSSGWVSLTPADNDPVRFWRCVLTTLQAQHPGLGDRALARLQARAPVWVVQDELVSDLAGLDRQLALVLDDYHCIQAPAIHSTIAATWWAVVPRSSTWSSEHVRIRHCPPRGCAANGQLLEIRADDLRFSASKDPLYSAALCTSICPPSRSKY